MSHLEKQFVKFTHHRVDYQSGQPDVDVEIVVHGIKTLTELREEFDNFLRACGYFISEEE